MADNIGHSHRPFFGALPDSCAILKKNLIRIYVQNLRRFFPKFRSKMFGSL